MQELEDRPLDPLRPAPSKSSLDGPGHRGPRPYPIWLELGGLAILLAAIVVPVVLLGGPSQTTAGSAPGLSSPMPTPRPVFQFASPSVRISALGQSKAVAASQAAAAGVQSALSTFYDQAFVDPAAWTRGVPGSAWDVFSPTVRLRAQRDSASLALGGQAPTLVHLFVIDTSLSVRVLVNQTGDIEVAAADVGFLASGELKGGRFMDITNRASFLFQQVAGHWVIVGYPVASTELKMQPSPTPTASGASPTPTASGGTP